MTRYLLAAALLLTSVGALACPLCLGWGQSSKAQQLVATPQAVLAVPTADATRFRVIADHQRVSRTADGLVEGGYPRSYDPAPGGATPTNDKPLLLVRDDPFPTFVVLGAIDAARADWLRAVAAGKQPTDRSAEEWRARLALVVPHLSDPEPLVAELAFSELGAAPYAALRTAKALLDAAALRRCLTDPDLAARQPLCLLLLGISGNAHDAAALEERLQAAWQSGDAANLSSMLAADLELRGVERVVVDRVAVSRRPETLEARDRGGAARSFRPWQRQRRHPARAGDPGLPGVHESAPGDRRRRRVGPCGLALLGCGAGLPRVDEVGDPAAISVAPGDARLP